MARGGVLVWDATSTSGGAPCCVLRERSVDWHFCSDAAGGLAAVPDEQAAQTCLAVWQRDQSARVRTVPLGIRCSQLAVGSATGRFFAMAEDGCRVVLGDLYDAQACRKSAVPLDGRVNLRDAAWTVAGDEVVLLLDYLGSRPKQGASARSRKRHRLGIIAQALLVVCTIGHDGQLVLVRRLALDHSPLFAPRSVQRRAHHLCWADRRKALSVTDIRAGCQALVAIHYASWVVSGGNAAAAKQLVAISADAAVWALTPGAAFVVDYFGHWPTT